MERDYYPFMISLDKCNGSCNIVDDLSTKISFLSKSEDVNVKVLNMIRRIKEVKKLVKQIQVQRRQYNV